MELNANLAIWGGGNIEYDRKSSFPFFLPEARIDLVKKNPEG